MTTPNYFKQNKPMKGICLKEPLFHATTEGRKTQTRRIINPPMYDIISAGRRFAGRNSSEEEWQYITPRYKVGEIIYLKEPYYVSNLMRRDVEYKYNSDLPNETILRTKWRNKLFMPADKSRYFIKITAVRAERLQEISDEDCLKEGIWMAENVGREGISYWYGGCVNSPHTTPQQAYAALIDKINGKGTWDSNPWVWVYDYELTEKPA